MKKLLTIILITITISGTYAQISIGPKLGLGVGSIRSKNLKDNLEAQKMKDTDIKVWDVNNKPGILLGLGAVVQYSLSDNLAIMTELTFNSLTSKIKIDYEENSVDGGGSGDITKIESKAKIQTSFVSIPLLVKYSLNGEEGPYFLGGLRINFTGTPKVTSEETKTKETYAGGALVKSEMEPRTVSAELDAFKSSNLNLVLGGGVSLLLNNKPLWIDLRYNLPISKSPMYTSSLAYENTATKNNEVFSVWGKTDAEIDVPSFKLDDFKMGFLEISAAYILFKK